MDSTFPIKSHGYYEYPSNADIAKSILKETDRQHLEEGLMRYLAEQGLEKYNNYSKIKKAVISALEGNQKALNQLKGLENKSLREIVIEAVGYGYVVKFILEEPWHYEIFKDPERPTTYPFQHKYSVWYRREQDHVWFSEKACDKLVQQKNFSEFYNHKSIFNTGELKPGSGHEEDQHKTDGGDYSLHHQEATYWDNQPDITGSSAIGHSGRWKGDSVRASILEAVIPTEDIEIHMKNRGTEGKRTDSLEQIHKLYGSPNKYLEDFNYWETRVVKKSVSIKHIRGIYPESRKNDPEEGFRKKYFLSLKDFHKYIYSKYPEAVPASPKCLDQNLSKKGSNHSEKELNKLQEELKITKEIEKLLSEAKSDLIDVKEIYAMIQGHSMSTHIPEEKRLRMAFQGLEKYNKSIRKIRELLEEEFNIEIEWNEVDSFEVFLELLKDEKLENLIDETRNELEEIRAEAFQETKAHEINDHVYQKFNKYMISELSRLPFIMISEREIFKNIDRMK